MLLCRDAVRELGLSLSFLATRSGGGVLDVLDLLSLVRSVSLLALSSHCISECILSIYMTTRVQELLMYTKIILL